MNKEKKLRHNPYKSDVFSLGMVLLECGVLKSVQDCYDKENKFLKEEILEELILEFKNNYPNEED